MLNLYHLKKITMITKTITTKTYKVSAAAVHNQHPTGSAELHVPKIELLILGNNHLRLNNYKYLREVSSSLLSSYEIPFHRSSTTNTSDSFVLPTLKASWPTSSVHLSLRSYSNATTRRSSVAKKVGDLRTPHSCR